MADQISNIVWIIIIIVNVIIYGLCGFLIIKKKSLTAISIRSPTLILGSILSNLIMSLALILPKLVDSSFITIFYYIFRLMMTISIFLRFERILACFRYNKDKFNTNENMEKFANKRYLLQEKFYVKIFIGVFVVIFIIILILELLKVRCFELFSCSYNKNMNDFKSQMFVWTILNFLENAAFMTYIFRLYEKRLRFILKKELYLLFAILFIYSNFVCLYNIFENYNDELFTLVSLSTLYILLLLNGFLPVFASFWYKNILNYQITPKLMNNLYLFLTNKKCYRKFYNYLMKAGDNSIYMLKLYTHIMKYKLDLAIKKNKEQGLREAKDIYYKYFENEGYLLYVTQDIIIKIQNKCEILRSNNYKEDLFDDGLEYAYNQLTVKFGEFIKSEDFKELNDDIELDSIVQCKMQNTGLINKF
jgi:hypothetical protein